MVLMSYTDSPAVALLATSCAICSRPLLDAASVTMGIGPVCREKYGYGEGPAENVAEANSLVYRIAVAQVGPEVEEMVLRLRALGFTKIANIIGERVGGQAALLTLDHDGRDFTLAFPYSAALVAEIKAALTGPRRFDGARKLWTLGVATAQAAAKAFEGRVTVTAAAAEALSSSAAAAQPDQKPSEGRVTDRGATICIETPYNAGAVSAIKTCCDDRAKWDPKDRCWSIPRDRASYVAAGLRPYFPGLAAELEALAPKETPEAVAGRQARDAARAARAALSNVAEADQARGAGDVVAAVRAKLAGALPAGKTLFPYQEAGVAFLEAAGGRALVADEMGLGKTVQALAWLAIHPELTKVLIVVPASLTLNWAREAGRWTPGRKVTVVGSTKAAVPADGLVVMSYEVATRKAVELEGWGAEVVILDEAHMLKSVKAKRTQAILGTEEVSR